jgi:hypothetical protein
MHLPFDEKRNFVMSDWGRLTYAGPAGGDLNGRWPHSEIPSGLYVQVSELQKEVGELKRENAALRTMVLAMWDAPGMPGANATLAAFSELNESK